jgi:hypothetical protein
VSEGDLTVVSPHFAVRSGLRDAQAVDR